MSDLTLHRFHGGLHLDDHKQESLQQPLQSCPAPGELVIRVSQHIGEMNRPLVKAGDTISRGQMLANNSAEVSAAVHSPVNGVIRSIEPRPVAHPSGQQADCFIIEVTDEQPEIEAASDNPLKPVAAEQLIEIIRDAGIVGLGGAVFPTSAKIIRAQQYGIDTLIINGAECEPYITCDHILMQSEPDRILRGVYYLQQIVNARQILIGIEDNKPQAIKSMQQQLDHYQSELGNAQIVTIPTIYPSGGEKQLIRILTGKEVHSRQLSFEIGILCQNVGTCAAVSDAVDRQQPLINRVVTITGPGIKNPGNWVAPIGTPIKHLIDQAGGYTVPQPRLIMGGPMMGLRLNTDEVPVVKATNCILVENEADQPEIQECIRCGKCTEVCPAQLLPQQLYWYSRSKQFDTTERYHLFDCIECGCCSAVCPSHLPLVQFYRYAKSEIWDQQRKAYFSDRSRKRFEFREARLQRIKQQEEERRRQKREALAKKKAQEEGQPDAKKTSADAVQAALERVKARKQSQQVAPKNTTNLTDAQRQQIEEADRRRQQIKPPPEQS